MRFRPVSVCLVGNLFTQWDYCSAQTHSRQSGQLSDFCSGTLCRKCHQVTCNRCRSHRYSAWGLVPHTRYVLRLPLKDPHLFKRFIWTGTRFVHTSEGKYLVTRLVPCPRCLCGLTAPADSLNEQDDMDQFCSPKPGEPAPRGSRNSTISDGGDSGVGHESPTSR